MNLVILVKVVILVKQVILVIIVKEVVLVGFPSNSGELLKLKVNRLDRRDGPLPHFPTRALEMGSLTFPLVS